MGMSKVYELSRDYARAWELIQRGDRLACYVDNQGYREIAETISRGIGNAVCIACRGTSYIYLWDDQYTFEVFKAACEAKKVDFYLPIDPINLQVSALSE